MRAKDALVVINNRVNSGCSLEGEEDEEKEEGEDLAHKCKASFTQNLIKGGQEFDASASVLLLFLSASFLFLSASLLFLLASLLLSASN